MFSLNCMSRSLSLVVVGYSMGEKLVFSLNYMSRTLSLVVGYIQCGGEYGVLFKLHV